jgi:exopolysaccharide production protein ExoQ
VIKRSLLHRTPLPRRLEFWLTVGCLFFIHGAFMMPGIPYVLGRHPLFFVRIGVATATLFLIYRNPKNFYQTLKQDRVLILLILFVIGSVLWSIDRGETIGAAFGLVMATFLGVYIAANYSSQEQLQLCLWALILVAILSPIAVLLLPEYAIMHTYATEGRWSGILGHKTNLGYSMGLLATLFLYVPTRLTKLPRWSHLLLFVLAVIILYFSKTAGATALLIFMIVLAPFYKLWLDYPPYRKRLALVALVGAVLGVGGILLNMDFVLGLLGRDSSFTGRTQIWWAAGEAIKLAPILGYGYEASFISTAPIQEFKNWKEAIHAHNVFLHIVLEIGLIGLSIYLWQYLRIVWLTGKRFLMRPSYAWGFTLIILIYYMVGSLMEMPPINQRRLVWVMYVAVVLTLFIRDVQLTDTVQAGETSAEAVEQSQ